jgi:hypothetical protein
MNIMLCARAWAAAKAFASAEPDKFLSKALSAARAMANPAPPTTCDATSHPKETAPGRVPTIRPARPADFSSSPSTTTLEQRMRRVSRGAQSDVKVEAAL